MAINFDKFFKNENEEVVSDKRMSDSLGLRIIRPTNYGLETKRIADLIKKGNIVAFTLENLSSEDGQRTYDYILGATTVLGGHVEKITDKVFASVPNGISVESLEVSEEKTEE